MKRHQSLLSLSNDHDFALTLLQRLKKRHSRALESKGLNKGYLQRDRTVEFFDTVWTTHLQAEEQFLFPLAEKYLLLGDDIVELLRKQHVQMKGLVDNFRTAHSGRLENLLLRFAHVLEKNIQKEERVFFRRIQSDVPDDQIIECGKQIENYFKQIQRAELESFLL